MVGRWLTRKGSGKEGPERMFCGRIKLEARECFGFQIASLGASHPAIRGCWLHVLGDLRNNV
jgi:hypothetical protein